MPEAPAPGWLRPCLKPPRPWATPSYAHCHSQVQPLKHCLARMSSSEGSSCQAPSHSPTSCRQVRAHQGWVQTHQAGLLSVLWPFHRPAASLDTPLSGGGRAGTWLSCCGILQEEAGAGTLPPQAIWLPYEEHYGGGAEGRGLLGDPSCRKGLSGAPLATPRLEFSVGTRWPGQNPVPLGQLSLLLSADP